MIYNRTKIFIKIWFDNPTMIGIDTYSWKKILDLFDEGWKSILLEIFNELPIFITHEVRKEFEHRFKQRKDYNSVLSLIRILPRLNSNYKRYLLKGFDEADASLLEYSEIESNVIVTEDQEMLNESVYGKNNIISLGDFFANLYENKFISSREFYHLIKWLRKIKNLTLNKEKKLLGLRF